MAGPTAGKRAGGKTGKKFKQAPKKSVTDKRQERREESKKELELLEARSTLEAAQKTALLNSFRTSTIEKYSPRSYKCKLHGDDRYPTEIDHVFAG